jgi:hypothetical protein
MPGGDLPVPRIRNTHGETRVLPWSGDREVEPGDVIDVPADQLDSYVEAGWDDVDAALPALLAAELAAVEDQAAGIDPAGPDRHRLDMLADRHAVLAAKLDRLGPATAKKKPAGPAENPEGN